MEEEREKRVRTTGRRKKENKMADSFGLRADGEVSAVPGNVADKENKKKCNEITAM